MKLLKIFAWIVFFPFMLTYWGWTKKNKVVIGVGAVLSVMFIVIGSTSTDSLESDNVQNPSDIQMVEVESESETIKEESSTIEEQTVESEESETNVADQEPDEKEGVAVQEESGNDDATETKQGSNGSDVDSPSETANETDLEETEEVSSKPSFEGYSWLEVDGGDLSGSREPNVVVDIGFGDREYYAFTNEHGQLVRVVADVIVLQDEENEPVLDTGRYYPDEAKVPGTESPDLDEGHVIADSLGGVANAYNITPQDSTLNRHGDQAYMEDQIRLAGGCKDFVAIITYPDINTQIPNHYSFTYTLMDSVINDEFDNVNPDEVNEALVEQEDLEEPTEAVTDTSAEMEPSDAIRIKTLNKKAEYVIIQNNSKIDISLSGWTVVSVKGNQTFVFPEGTILLSGQEFKITSYQANGTGNFIMADGRIWNDKDYDPAELYDNNGVLISRFED